MYVVTCAIVLAVLSQGKGSDRFETEHARNAVYSEVIATGLEAGGASVKLPEPKLRDGQSAEEQRTALREVAGSDRRLRSWCASRSRRRTS